MNSTHPVPSHAIYGPWGPHVESWPASARSLAPQDDINFTDLFRRASEEELQHKNI
jgi:hypothetical protein